jgi:putative two-component system response regulator
MMIEILSNLVEFRNGESGLHVLHIQTLTELFLEHLLKKTDRYVISDQDRHLICNAAALHDIGKMAVPEEILNKPGRLTKEEFEIMKTHTVEGAKILEEIPNWKMEPLIQYAHQICRWHHERYDGSGYPDGLVGESIPIAAQIVALADVYDALTSRRVYKPAYSHEKAIEMIINGECGVFNPLLLECLTDMADYLEEALQKKYNEIHTEKAIRKTVDQMLASRNLEPSDRTLRLLEREKLKYQFLADASREILFEYTVEPEMVLISGGGARELGMPESFLDPKESSFGMEMFRHEDFQRFLEEMRNTTPESPAYEGDYLLNIRGHKRWCKVMACSMWEVGDNAIQYEGAVGKITDIHDATEMIHHLEKIAVLDSLTGLLNPKAAKLQISTILSAHPDKTYAFMMLDLDNFKMANDQHGHLFGDQVLTQVANAFEQNMASADIASRIGDEFLFFFQYEDNVEEKVDRLFQEISIDFNGYPIRASVGVALSKDCNGDYESLFRMADTAMYAAKHYGKNNYQFYRDDMKEQFASISQGSALDWTN